MSTGFRLPLSGSSSCEKRTPKSENRGLSSYQCVVPYALMRLLFYACAVFFAALHAFITAYINSTVALQIGGQSGIFLTFLLGSLIALAGFYTASSILRRIGNRRLLLLWCLIDLAALALLSTGIQMPMAQLGALALHIAAAPLIGYSLDLFFERAMPQGRITGFSRGVFLTAGNIALVASPFLSGILLTYAGSATVIYALSALSLVLFLGIILAGNRSYRDPTYPRQVTLSHIGRTLVGPLGPILASHFTLRVFYGWAPVYLPLYLTLILGFSWTEAGIILAVALLPFALFELPLGTLEDRYCGEREVLCLGFVVLAASIAALWFMPGHSLIAVAAIMFMTRVGAAMVEIATETNFFRQVRAEHADTIVLFRMLGPLGWIAGVSLAATTVLVLPMPYAFGALGAIMLLGLIPALRIHDAR